jgi:energy-coupling factor transporter ATP-binding protein EcfA2
MKGEERMANLDLIDVYIEYTDGIEIPKVYHRWCAITAISALLGRKYYFDHGHFRIFPNMYVMLIGDAGARKSTAIKLIRKIISKTGYNSFASDKTTQEKFLLDLEGEDDVEGTAARNITDINLWGNLSEKYNDPREVFIVADEFNEFAGSGNLDFYSMLGNLWDWDDSINPFTRRLKNSKSVSIYQPTISILGGNTQEGFSRAFPPDIIGQGFLSRLLIIYGQRTGRKITFPETPEEEETAEIVGYFRNILNSNRGPAILTKGGMDILNEIYQTWEEIDDARFVSYSNRRFTQLIKLSLIIVAAEDSGIITDNVVIKANTILSAAEICMPKALGQFGKGKNSDVSNKIIELLSRAERPMTTKDIWQHVSNDLDKFNNLQELIQGLTFAQKIQQIMGQGFLVKQKQKEVPKYVDFSILTDEEKMMINQ